MNDVQSRIQSLIDQLCSDGTERGLQVTVYREGTLLVDACAGIADPATGAPVTNRTLFPVFSVGKGMLVTMVYRAIQAGSVALEMPIAEVWPEFAAHGKGGVTLRHVLSHTAGIPFMPRGIGYAEVGHWDTMCAAIADQVPVNAPGERANYHAITVGWILGETLRRADGRPMPRRFDDEIRCLLGLVDMYVGIPDVVEDRVAVLECIENYGGDLPDDTQPRAVPGWMGPLTYMMNRPDARRCCNPASNGIMSTAAIARHYAALLPGGVDGRELLPPELVAQASAPFAVADPVGGYSHWGCGYPRIGDGTDPEPRRRFGSCGYGGAAGWVDLDRRLGVGIAKNRFNDGDTTGQIRREIEAAVDAL